MSFRSHFFVYGVRICPAYFDITFFASQVALLLLLLRGKASKEKLKYPNNVTEIHINYTYVFWLVNICYTQFWMAAA